MFRHLSTFFFLCLLTCGCTNKNYEQVTRFHDDGRSKPIVAIVPVFDRTQARVGWSLSEEFTDHIKYQIAKGNDIYLSSSDEINKSVENLNEQDNPFQNECEWIQAAFPNQEYVVFTEFVEYDIHRKEISQRFIDKLTPSSELSMTMRIRVFDLRAGQVKIILQELIHQDHLIPKGSSRGQEDPDKWKRVTFPLTPLGIAHGQFSRQAAKRIKEYITLAKSN